MTGLSRITYLMNNGLNRSYARTQRGIVVEINGYKIEPYAYLEGANLRGANLKGAYLEGANLPHFQICPQEGSFIGYKKTTKGVIKLLIAEHAKRTNSLIGRKCRASEVVVLGGEGVDGTGTHYQGIVYGEGNTIKCLDYDDDIRVECTKGIHFFMTLAEAEEWG